MKSLYLILDLASVSLPLLFSLIIRLYRRDQWVHLLLSTTVTAVLFLIWDIAFTSHGIWGFNSTYHLDILFLGLPLEEILFFFCIPFASLFIHFLLHRQWPSIGYRDWIPGWTLIAMGLIVLFLGIWHYQLWYTFVDLSLAGLLLIWGGIYQPHLLRAFIPSFLLILIPFFAVNGILTGGYTPDPVVWYNNSENLGIRLGSIPLEDLAYTFSMLFLNLLIWSRLEKGARAL